MRRLVAVIDPAKEDPEEIAAALHETGLEPELEWTGRGFHRLYVSPDRYWSARGEVWLIRRRRSKRRGRPQ